VQDAQVSCVHGRTGTTFFTLFNNNVQGAIVANIMEYYSLTQINSGTKNVVKFICQ